MTTHAGVTRAEIAVGVVSYPDAAVGEALLTLPGALDALRRDHDPLTRQRIATAMGAL